MGFPIAAGVTAGAGLVGGLLGNASSAHEAHLNRRFQKNMRATSYQTAVEDMRKAGLNPALAYQQGGAGNVSGSTASQDDPLAGAIKGAQTGVDMVQRQADTMKTVAETRKSMAEVKYLEAIAEERARQFGVRGRILDTGLEISGQKNAQEALETQFRELANPKRLQLLRGNLELQGKQITGASLANQLAGLEVPEASASAAFYRSPGGKFMPAVNSALSVFERLKGMLLPANVGGGRSLSRRRMRP